MDEPDLELLRTWGADLVEPPTHLQAHIEEELWHAVFAEEARAARPHAARRTKRWFDGLLRPAVAAGAAATLALGVAITSSGGLTTTSSVPRSAGIVQAGNTGLLDAAATSLFGDASSGAPAGTISGRIDLRSADSDAQQFIDGPTLDRQTGLLSAESAEFAQSMTREPGQLRDAARRAAALMVGSDPTDRVAFHLTMQWVVNREVPVELRAAMFRSMDDLTGVDPASRGVDLLGRAGVLIGHLDATTGLREQYLLQLDDATLIERRGFTTSHLDPACPPGTIIDHAVFDDAGQAVSPQDTQWLAWPPVIPACAPGAATL
ncbi:MAG: hypothetical protein ABI200_01380 [Gaiellales bacterium]